MAQQNSTSGGIGISGALFLVFLVLKLAEVGSVANWSWWWVTSPLWIPIVIFVALAGLYIMFKFLTGSKF